MVSNEEIKIRLESKREGKDPEEAIKKALEMQIPYEWVDGGFLFDFNSVSVEDLSNIIKGIFEEGEYHLEEGTPVNGIYGRGHESLRLLVGFFAFRYKFKVEIYTNEGKTFLKISKATRNLSTVFIDGPVYGNMFYNKEFYRIVDTVKYLRPIYEGYLVCNKCGDYYKLQPGESPEDFDVCLCGGSLKYVEVLIRINAEILFPIFIVEP